MSLPSRPNLYDYIKILALVSMIFDHIGYFLFPEQIWLRVVGRLAFPLFLFLVGYNLSRRRRWSLWIPAIVIQLGIFWAYWEDMSATWTLNILLAIGITRVVLLYTSKLSRGVQLLIFLAACALAPQTFAYIDYGTLSIAFGFLGYRLRTSSHRWYRLLLVALIAYHLFLMISTSWFPPATYGWLGGVGIVIILLCLLLSKQNYPLVTHTLRDRIILFISRYALVIYVVHGAVLFLLSLLIKL